MLPSILMTVGPEKRLSVMTRNGVPRGKTEGQVLRALQGHKIVAGGNAPGKPHARSPTLEGSHSLGP